MSSEAPLVAQRRDADEAAVCPVLGVLRDSDGLCTALYGPWLCVADAEQVGLWLPYEAPGVPEAFAAGDDADALVGEDDGDVAVEDVVDGDNVATEELPLAEPLSAREAALLAAMFADDVGDETRPRGLPSVEELPPAPLGDAEAGYHASPRLLDRLRARHRGVPEPVIAHERGLVAHFGAQRFVELDALHRAAVRVHARTLGGQPLSEVQARTLIQRTYVEAQIDKHARQLEEKQQREAHRRETAGGWVGLALFAHLVLLLLIWSIALIETDLIEEVRSLILGQQEMPLADFVETEQLTTEEAFATEALDEPIEEAEQPEIVEPWEFAEPLEPDIDVPELVLRERPSAPPNPQLAPELSGLEISGVDLSGAQLPAGANARVSESARRAALRRHGGTPETEAAVREGLAWLARQQLRDGSWSASEVRDGSTSRGAAMHQVGFTGLALLCFLGAGHTHQRGDYRQVVSRGLDYLVHNQITETGGFASAGEHWRNRTYMYDQGLALLAVTEAYAMTGDQRLRAPIVRGLRQVEASQMNTGGWDYIHHDGADADGRSDVSIAGWIVMAMRSGLNAGFEVRRETWVRTQRLILEQTTHRGDVRYAVNGTHLDPRRGIGITAVAALCRLYDLDVRRTREASASSPPLVRTLEWLTDNPPSRQTHIAEGSPRRSIPVGEWPSDHPFFHSTYYWYYGTLALFEYTDGTGPVWRRWNEHMQQAIVPAQRSDGGTAYEGSWDPVGGFWSRYWGRLGDTCMNILCLEVYYRHLPLYVGTDRRLRLVEHPSEDATSEAERGSDDRNGADTEVTEVTDAQQRVERAERQLHAPGSSEATRMAAAEVLADDRGLTARRALARAVRSRSVQEPVRAHCARLLGQIAAADTLDTLAAALDDSFNRDIRHVILKSIGHLNTPGAFDVLVEGLRNARSIRERDAAQAGLQALTKETEVPPNPDAWQAWRQRNPHVNRSG